MVGSKLVVIATLEIEIGFSDTHSASEIKMREVARMVDALVTESIKMDPFEGEITSAELHTCHVVKEE